MKYLRFNSKPVLIVFLAAAIFSSVIGYSSQKRVPDYFSNRPTGCEDGKGIAKDYIFVTKAPDPPVGKPLTGIKLYEGWTDPRALPDTINTFGWEDSAYISSDGTTLYFGYSQLLTKEGRLKTSGPNRIGQNGPAFDIYEAKIESGAWKVENSIANSKEPYLGEAAIGVNRKQDVMAFVRFDPEGDIYLSRREHGVWTVPIKLPYPINTKCIEDNPHLSPDGRTIYFDSNRSDLRGTSCIDEKMSGQRRTIYVSKFNGEKWLDPRPLRGTPNEMKSSWQVFVSEDANHVYWTGVDDDCPTLCIYHARLAEDGSYKNKTLVMQPVGFDNGKDGDIVAVGEMSITSDNRFLYFVYLQRISEIQFDFSIGVARREKGQH